MPSLMSDPHIYKFMPHFTLGQQIRYLLHRVMHSCIDTLQMWRKRRIVRKGAMHVPNAPHTRLQCAAFVMYRYSSGVMQHDNVIQSFPSHLWFDFFLPDRVQYHRE